MRARKKAYPHVFEEIERCLAQVGTQVDDLAVQKRTVEISGGDLTREEKMLEASKPLYLRRYE
jgi:hypothetical protein